MHCWNLPVASSYFEMESVVKLMTATYEHGLKIALPTIIIKLDFASLVYYCFIVICFLFVEFQNIPVLVSAFAWSINATH